jgi:hypothetical protein
MTVARTRYVIWSPVVHEQADHGTLGGLVKNAYARRLGKAKLVLDAHDEFIAGRIAATLEAREIGLLFIGALHSLAGRLPPGVELVFLGEAVRRTWK